MPLCAARGAISGAATWRSPSISRRLIPNAEAARDRGSNDPPATGHQMARVHGPQPHPVTCGKLAIRDANRTSYPFGAHTAAVLRVGRGQPACRFALDRAGRSVCRRLLVGVSGKQIFGGGWGCGQRGHAQGWPLGVDVRSRDWASSYERVAVADSGDPLLIVGGLMGGLL